MDKWFGGEFSKVIAMVKSNRVILTCQVKSGSFCLGIICLCYQEGEITIFSLNLKTQIMGFDVARLNEYRKIMRQYVHKDHQSPKKNDKPNQKNHDQPENY